MLRQIVRVSLFSLMTPLGYWYYCASAQRYYPGVSTCQEAWIRVPPRLNWPAIGMTEGEIRWHGHRRTIAQARLRSGGPIPVRGLCRLVTRRAGVTALARHCQEHQPNPHQYPQHDEGADQHERGDIERHGRDATPAGRVHQHGLNAWAEVKQHGYEGLVAKREDSPYRGGRTREWLKVKVRHEGRFFVVGLDVPRSGNCSLLLATRQRRRLVYVSRVEWGATRAVIARIRASGARWCRHQYARTWSVAVASCGFTQTPSLRSSTTS